MKSLKFSSRLCLFLMTSILLFLSCQDKEVTRETQQDTEPGTIIDEDFSEYILSHTAGFIPRESEIEIRSSQPILESFSIDQELPQDILSFHPDVKGKLIKKGESLIVFYPEIPLKEGTNYQANLDLTQLFSDVDEDLSEFTFQFSSIEQDYEVRIFPPEIAADGSGVSFRGEIETADRADGLLVEQMLEISGNYNIEPQWEHQGNLHSFTYDGFEQGEDYYNVKLNWSGRVIGVNRNGNQEIIIPGKVDFSFTEHRIISQGGEGNYIALYFSNPLLKDQDLDGLIQLQNDRNIRTVIDENVIKVFPSRSRQGQHQLTINQGIKSITQEELNEDVQIQVVFSAEKPQVRLIGSSGIYTGSSSFFIPFEAISLKAVDIQIVRIYEDNVTRFYQFNSSMKNNNNLEMVGRPVFHGSVDLDEDEETNLYQWNRFSIDLSNYIEEERGAIYWVSINFRRSQTLYPGAIQEGEDPRFMDRLPQGNWDGPGAERSNWDYYSNYYEYNWQDRDNPTTDSYYARNRRRVSLSLLATDIGIIAKGESNGDLLVALSSLSDASPLSGADIIAYNYQLQEIGSSQSNREGIASVSCQGIPFLITVKHNGQSNYLKVDQANALSLSNFDIEGMNALQGVKGYIYGERGVWRPGDHIFLSFILEDKENHLPDNLPVIFELRNPSGQVTDRQVSTQGVLGIYPFRSSTEQEAPTGQWTATVRLGDNVFERNIPIETVKPNRLRINLTPDVDTFTYENTRERRRIALKSEWLHGAPARNLRALVELNLVPFTPRFEGYGEYSFSDPSVQFHEPKQEIFQGSLNNQGEVSFDVNMKVEEQVPAALQATFHSRVFEEGGNFSINQISYPFYPYESYVGLRTPPGDRSRGMLLTDEDHTVDIVTIDSQGAPLSRREINVRLYKLQWRWWWDKSPENWTNFINRSGTTLIDRGNISTENGRGSWTLRVDYPSWGRYLLVAEDPDSGHQSGKIIYMDWPGWAGSPQRGGDSASMLSVYTDNKDYETGDTIQVNIPSSPGGRALVSVEKGGSVIDAWWVDTQDKMTHVQFEATAEMSPNAYIHVTLVQGLESKENDSPIRMYGITPVNVVNPSTQLNPVLTMAPQLSPDRSFQVKVSEEDGRTMAYTLAVVDEGLLDLTNFQTPHPWGHFYGKESLAVRTWDMYKEVIGTFSGDLGSLLAPGGSDFSVDESKQQENRFTPVVIYQGPFLLRSGETRTHNLEMPHYVGSVRTMVIATDGLGAYGDTEQATVVKQNLMAQGTLPRVAGPEEVIEFPVTIFNDAGDNLVTVEFFGSGNLEVLSASRVEIRTGDDGEENVRFRIKVGPTAEDVHLGVKVRDGENETHWETDLEIREPNRVRTHIDNFVLQTDEEKSISVDYFGTPGSNSAFLELTTLPPINLEQRSQWLIRYPHGCIEQTTSSAFPQLYIGDLKELSSSQQESIQTNVEAAIARLSTFQLPSGGFSYWPGNGQESDWGSTYAGHFLVEARNKGYHVPEDLLSDWSQWQEERANRWSGEDDLNQAYRLYTLALYGNAATGAMNRLREQNRLSVAAQWRLAAAYAVNGKKRVAEEILQDVRWDIPAYRSSSRSYGSAMRDKAMVLETLALLDRNEDGLELIMELSEILSSDASLSTQTISYSLIALAKYYKGSNSGMDLDVLYNIGGVENRLRSNQLISIIPLESDQDQIIISNQSEGQLFLSLSTTGIPAPGDEIAENSNLKVSMEILDSQGNPVNHYSLTSGTDIRAIVRIENQSGVDLEEIALTTLFPAGWEILNTRGTDMTPYGQSLEPEYQDFRDDRIYSYFDLPAREGKTLVFFLNAAYRGTFYFPGLICEDMYNTDTYSYTRGNKVEIR